MSEKLGLGSGDWGISEEVGMASLSNLLELGVSFM